MFHEEVPTPKVIILVRSSPQSALRGKEKQTHEWLNFPVTIGLPMPQISVVVKDIAIEYKPES